MTESRHLGSGKYVEYFFESFMGQVELLGWLAAAALFRGGSTQR